MKKLVCILSVFFTFIILADDSKEDVNKNVDSFLKDSIKKEKEKKKEKKKKEKKKEKTNDSTSENSNDDSNDSNDSSTAKTAYDFSNVISGFALFVPEFNNIDFTLFSVNAYYNFQYWEPNYINNATFETTTINYATFEANILNKLIYIKYETAFGSTPMEEQKKLLEKRENSSGKWEKFLADFEFPYIIKDENWYLRFYISFTKEIFSSKVVLNEDKEYVSRDNNLNNSVLFTKGSFIGSETIFEDYLLGLRLYSNNPSWILRLGLYYLTYDKPYSLTVENSQDNYIFDTTFSSLGFYGGISFDYSDFLEFDFDLKVGSGSIYLIGLDRYLEDDPIMEKEDMYLAYIETDLGISLYKTFYDYFKLTASGKMQLRKFYMSENQTDEEIENEEEPITLDVNKDIIFTFFVGLSVGF